RVHRGAPDDPGRRRDLLLHDLRAPLCLRDRHVRPARDVHEDAVGRGDVHLEERGVDRFRDRLERAAVPDRLALAHPDHPGAASPPRCVRASTPTPRVTRRRSSIFLSALIARRCWASVFAAYSSAPTTHSSWIRAIVFVPPPPTPTILMFVRILLSSSSSS